MLLSEACNDIYRTVSWVGSENLLAGILLGIPVQGGFAWEGGLLGVRSSTISLTRWGGGAWGGGGCSCCGPPAWGGEWLALSHLGMSEGCVCAGGGQGYPLIVYVKAPWEDNLKGRESVVIDWTVLRGQMGTMSMRRIEFKSANDALFSDQDCVFGLKLLKFNMLKEITL